MRACQIVLDVNNSHEKINMYRWVSLVITYSYFILYYPFSYSLSVQSNCITILGLTLINRIGVKYSKLYRGGGGAHWAMSLFLPYLTSLFLIFKISLYLTSFSMICFASSYDIYYMLKCICFVAKLFKFT